MSIFESENAYFDDFFTNALYMYFNHSGWIYAILAILILGGATSCTTTADFREAAEIGDYKVLKEDFAVFTIETSADSAAFRYRMEPSEVTLTRTQFILCKVGGHLVLSYAKGGFFNLEPYIDMDSEHAYFLLQQDGAILKQSGPCSLCELK